MLNRVMQNVVLPPRLMGHPDSAYKSESQSMDCILIEQPPDYPLVIGWHRFVYAIVHDDSKTRPECFINF